MRNFDVSEYLWRFAIIFIPASFLSVCLLLTVNGKIIISQLLSNSPATSLYATEALRTTSDKAFSYIDNIPFMPTIALSLFWVCVGLAVYFVFVFAILFVHTLREEKNMSDNYLLPDPRLRKFLLERMLIPWVWAIFLILMSVLVLLLLILVILPLSRQLFLAVFFESDLYGLIYTISAVFLLSLFITTLVLLISLFARSWHIIRST